MGCVATSRSDSLSCNNAGDDPTVVVLPPAARQGQFAKHKLGHPRGHQPAGAHHNHDAGTRPLSISALRGLWPACGRACARMRACLWSCACVLVCDLAKTREICASRSSRRCLGLRFTSVGKAIGTAGRVPLAQLTCIVVPLQEKLRAMIQELQASLENVHNERHFETTAKMVDTLHDVAAWCTVLQHVALCCSKLALCCNMSLCVAPCCTALHRAVLCCNTTWRAGCDRQGGRPREEHPAPPQDRRRARSNDRRARRAAA